MVAFEKGSYPIFYCNYKICLLLCIILFISCENELYPVLRSEEKWTLNVREFRKGVNFDTCSISYPTFRTKVSITIRYLKT